MRNGDKPSKVLADFVEYLKSCQDLYETSKSIVKEEDLKEQDFFHALEFEDKCEVRSRTSTMIHKSRKARRQAKNDMEMVEKIVTFCRKEQTKLFVKQLKQLSAEQKSEEERLNGERIYKPRSSVWKEIQGNQKEGDSNDST